MLTTPPLRPGLSRLFRALAGALTLAAPGLLRAAEFQFSSGPAQVPLIELYTSEGCSSCPPADRWLEALRSRPGLWHDFVPVGFHVNYWDHLGWRDRFATKPFTQRQYALAGQWGSHSVYTPCFARDGREWHPSGDLRPSASQRPGVLAAALGADGICRIRFSPEAGVTGRWEAHLALLGGGYASKVLAGENRGETLRPEFVVLALADAPLQGKPGGATADLPLPANPIMGATRQAVAIWVTPLGRLEPVQATGGWL